MSANIRQTRIQDRRGSARPIPDPPLSDHENEESEPESEQQPEPARRRTPHQRPRSETPQRRRARDRDPEDFDFLPQYVNPGGNRNFQSKKIQMLMKTTRMQYQVHQM
jgi:hypothetical protein